MNSQSFLNSDSEIRSELHAVIRTRKNNREKVKIAAVDCNKAIADISNSGKDIANEAFGADMSSKAITASNVERNEIRKQLKTTAIEPAKEAITNTRNALREL